MDAVRKVPNINEDPDAWFDVVDLSGEGTLQKREVCACACVCVCVCARACVTINSYLKPLTADPGSPNPSLPPKPILAVLPLPHNP